MTRKQKATQEPPPKPSPNLPMSGEAFVNAPRFYCTYTQLSIREEVSLTFALKHEFSPEPDQPGMEVAVPQAVVFMSMSHFLRFAEMISRNAIELQAKIQKLRTSDEGELVGNVVITK